MSHHIELEFARARDSDDPHAFSFAPQEYIVTTPGARARQIRVDWNVELLDQLHSLQRPGQASETAAALGASLRRILEGAGWELLEARINQAVQEEATLLLTIRSSAAELFALPWELLSLQGLGLPLGALPTVLLRYEWPGTSTRPTNSPRARVLLAWSGAGGAVPHEAHAAAITRAHRRSHMSGTTLPNTLANASLSRLADRLEQAERDGEPIGALHLLCHGGAEGESVGLTLGDDRGGASVVDASSLARVLLPHADMLRLVVIAACSSGDALPGRLGSVAQMLHRAGIQAVLASRLPLSTDGSIRFAEVFYEALLVEGETLERSVLAARQSLYAELDARDWASVQLYARAEDGSASDVLGVGAVLARARVPVEPSLVSVSTPEAPRRRLWPLVTLASLVTVGLALTLVIVTRGGPHQAPDEIVAPLGQPLETGRDAKRAAAQEHAEEEERGLNDESSAAGPSATASPEPAPAPAPTHEAAAPHDPALVADPQPVDPSTETPTSAQPKPTSKKSKKTKNRAAPKYALKHAGGGTRACEPSAICNPRKAALIERAVALTPRVSACLTRGDHSAIERWATENTIWNWRLKIELVVNKSGAVKARRIVVQGPKLAGRSCIVRALEGIQLPAIESSSPSLNPLVVWRNWEIDG